MSNDIQQHSRTLAAIEWLSVKEAARQFSLSRSAIYELIAAGLIKSSVIRKPGNVRGRRLISAESIRMFVENHAEGGNQDSK